MCSKLQTRPGATPLPNLGMMPHQTVPPWPPPETKQNTTLDWLPLPSAQDEGLAFEMALVPAAPKSRDRSAKPCGTSLVKLEQSGGAGEAPLQGLVERGAKAPKHSTLLTRRPPIPARCARIIVSTNFFNQFATCFTPSHPCHAPLTNPRPVLHPPWSPSHSASRSSWVGPGRASSLA